MDRRSFISKSAVVAGMAAVGCNSAKAVALQAKEDYTFSVKFAPHFGMFKHHAGEDLIDQLKFMADQGFTAFEDNGMRNREVSLQENIAKTMMDLGMEMGVFVAHQIYWKEPSLTSGKQDSRDEFLGYIRDAVEVAKRVNAKWMTVVPGHLDLRQDMGYQTAHVVETLKQACGILEPHGLTMVLEPLNLPKLLKDTKFARLSIVHLAKSCSIYTTNKSRKVTYYPILKNPGMRSVIFKLEIILAGKSLRQVKSTMAIYSNTLSPEDLMAYWGWSMAIIMME